MRAEWVQLYRRGYLCRNLYKLYMPVDLFQLLKPDSDLHPDFVKTRDDPLMAPARGALRDVAATLTDPDGNLVEQFQTHGFNARTFEIYLHAFLTAEGHEINRTHDRPDFIVRKGGVSAAIEAVTANPPPSRTYRPYRIEPEEVPTTEEEMLRELKDEPAIRFGSPLYSKMRKRYWELPHVAGLPFILAIETFHDGGLRNSSDTLSQYLFGVDHRHSFDEDGMLVVNADSIDRHVGSKTIPSNFFGQPNGEHVSAVLFSNAGTIPKFGRIGQQGVHRSEGVRMIRYGTCYSHAPNATMAEPFFYEVGDPEVPLEPWRDGAVLIHNPRALHPLPEEWLGASKEEYQLPAGNVGMTWRDPFLPYTSITALYSGDTRDRAIRQDIAARMRLLRMGLSVAELMR